MNNAQLFERRTRARLRVTACFIETLTQEILYSVQCYAFAPCRDWIQEMAANAIAPRNGGRIESTFLSRAAQPLSWGVCSQTFNFITA